MATFDARQVGLFGQPLLSAAARRSGSGGSSKRKAKTKATAPSKISSQARNPASSTNSRRTSSKESDSTAAHRMARRQREISVSEFFTKNRHLLGFDNPRKALLTTIKEAVDNSLDACEEAEVLPEIRVEIQPTKRDDRFVVCVEDNGPGILKSQMPQIFARLLYGSKFHTLKQQRGQQGIGISAAAMYGQLTTGKPIRVISRISKRHSAYQIDLKIDTNRNRPEVLRENPVDWDRHHGTRIQITLEARAQHGRQSVDEYLHQTAISNPHLQLTYTDWENKTTVFDRVTKKLPPPAKEIKPHPYGIEVGYLGNMIAASSAKKIGAFLRQEFSRISTRVAQEIVQKAGITMDTWLKSVTGEQVEALQRAMQSVKVMAPSTDCVTPIGEAGLLAGAKKEIEADLFLAHSRSPKIYRGNPFVVEVAMAYGGELPAEDPVRVLRLANRVPLQYQAGACAIHKSVITTDWRNYLLTQPRGAPPLGPMVLVVHLASVWVPFTSEAKEAVAHYPEILKELRLALQDLGRRLATHIRKRRREADQAKKKAYIEAYLDPIGEALQEILEFSDQQKKTTVTRLKEILEKSRKM